MSPAKKPKYDLGRKYLPSWEKDHHWVKQAPDDPKSPYCKVCRKKLLARKCILNEHEKSANHISNMKAVTSSQTINFVPTPKVSKLMAVKVSELQLSAAVCCHMSINAIDHFGEIVKKNGTGSSLEDLKLHRTKCSRLIDHVLAPSLKEELKDDLALAECYFSVLVDESTDFAINKNLCICIVYFSKSTEKIESTFLGLFPVISTTGESLFAVIKEALSGVGLSLSKCIGFGSDGAANMIGERNSVWSRIKEEAPNCILFKCICHSLALCIEKAFNSLPSSLGFLMSEVSAWFSKSTLRREDYREMCQEEHKKLFDEMATDDEFDTLNREEASSSTMPFSKISTTRWLARGKVIKSLLSNWNTLKVYFGSVLHLVGQDARFKVSQVHQIFDDDRNYLYLVFLMPLVKEFEQANIFFQATFADPEAITKELTLLHHSVKARIKDSRGNDLASSLVQYGATFSHEVEKLKKVHQKEIVSFQSHIDQVQNWCHGFLRILLKEVEARLPLSQSVLQGLNNLHPVKVLSQTLQMPFHQLPSQPLMSDKDLIQIQYRKIQFHPWREETIFSEGFPKQTAEFWSKVLSFQRSDGVQPYKELALYALSAISVPVSNAVVERIFSHVTFIKNKYRNRMKISMLDSIIRVRLHLLSRNICCKDFVPTERMKEKFNSAMYINESDVCDISGLE